jgi:hypothetical protein
MWNSNSIIAWLLERSGLDINRITPPSGGRAPGWNAGIVVARRQSEAGLAPSASLSPLVPGKGADAAAQRELSGHVVLLDQIPGPTIKRALIAPTATVSAGEFPGKANTRKPLINRLVH